MDNQFPRVTAILDRIPDAATRWPGWMWPVCGVCGEDCDLDANGEHFCMKHDADSIVPKFGPPTDGQGADVWHGCDTDPRNMHHLWAMLEAVDDNKSPCLANDEASVFHAGQCFFGCSPNIIEAMLRCLEEATR